jgi:hypothetical protein
MSRARRSRTRRHRRTGKQLLKYGPSAKRSHKRKTGRTGRIFTKHLKSLEKR